MTTTARSPRYCKVYPAWSFFPGMPARCTMSYSPAGSALSGPRWPMEAYRAPKSYGSILRVLVPLNQAGHNRECSYERLPQDARHLLADLDMPGDGLDNGRR